MACSIASSRLRARRFVARLGCNAQGFTLVELAISLLIISLIVGFGLRFMGTHGAEACPRSTTDELALMQNAIDQFVATNGRYPLPASRHAGYQDAGYGREASGPFDSGINRVPQASPVLIGALPHVALNLPTELESDCWGNKFTYAVTQNFTTTAGYSNGGTFGGIILRYGPIGAATELDSEAAYAIVSHGPDALGASRASHHGPEIHCNSAVADLSQTRIDKENCDIGNAIFYMSEYNRENKERYFDDFVVVANRVVSPNDCGAGPVTWGGNCQGTALLTLAGLSVDVTNTTPGYTGLAVSTCTNGVRSTLGVCLPIGACIYNNPRNGSPTAVLTLTSMNYGIGICKTCKCCSGAVTISPLVPCLTSLDLPGVAISCP